MQINIYKDPMQKAYLFGTAVLYSEKPIPREDVPQHWSSYELRGTVQRPDTPYALEDQASYNFAGSILSPLPLKADSAKSRLVKGKFELTSEYVRLAEFCSEYQIPQLQTPIRHMFRPASSTESGLFYALPPEKDEELGAIGHVRIDFGYKGREFWHTWWPRGPEELNTPEFKEELGKVVNDLRLGVLKDLPSMRRYCWGLENGAITGGTCCQNYGFTLETDRYIYRLRCNPTEGDYQAYLGCFDKQAQKQEMGLTEKGRQMLRDAADPSLPHQYSWYVIQDINSADQRVDQVLPLDEAIEHYMELDSEDKRLGVTKDDIATVDLVIRKDGREWISEDYQKLDSFAQDPVVAEAVGQIRQALEEQTQGQTMTRNNIMLVQLHCGGYSIGLQLPASPADVQQKLDTLRNGSEQNAPISIRDVNEPLSYLRQYIQNVDLTSGPELEKLNQFSKKVDGMSAQEQHILWGALDAEGIDGLDDVLSIASSLGQYQFVEDVTSYKQLGGWLVEHGLARVDFPEEVRPYLNYEGIGLEYGDSHGGAFTPYGYVKRWEEVQTQKAEDRPSFALTLVSAAGAVHLDLPASDDQMEAAKRALRLDSLDSSVIGDVKIGYAWSHLLPMDSITLKDANTLAECVRQMTQQELRVFGAALEVEEPRSFYDAGCIAMDRDDYELVTSNEAEYGREALRYAGAGDEILEILDGFTDFDALGRSEMETDGVRESSFGSVRRLSAPWPRQEPAQPEPERGMTMGMNL